ncbi:MAG TPA: P-loop NTPase, partial [Limnochordia bacterium]
GVATRAANMARKTNQKIIGVVENMSSFICPHCNEATPIFGEGGGERVAEILGVPLLGEIPLSLEARSLGDRGIPVASTDEGTVARAFQLLAERVASAVGVSQPARR